MKIARSRYHLCISISVLLAFSFIVAACNDSSTSTTKVPTAQQLISSAQTAIQQVKSYHFNLNTDKMGTDAGASIAIKSADGDTLVPDKLSANANALVSGFAVQTKIIAIDDKQYYLSPLTGQWSPVTGILDPRALSDSKTGVATILGQIQNPGKPTDSNVDGTACWSIDGTLDTKYLAGITGGGTPAGTTVATNICVGKSDKLPYLIRITGIAVQGDNADTSRTFKLSKFNESITITAPI